MKNRTSQKGYTMVEILVVVIILSVFVAFALISWVGIKKYAVDDQAHILADTFAEARQYAFNQRRIFRVEINKTRSAIVLIDENEPNDVTDDQIFKTISFKQNINIGVTPGNITGAPTASSPIPVLPYVTSSYPLSLNQEKITLRFGIDGRVLDTGTNNNGGGSIMRGATIYLFSNKEKTITPEIIRAITVLQTSGDISIVKCSFGADGKCGNWKK